MRYFLKHHYKSKIAITSKPKESRHARKYEKGERDALRHEDDATDGARDTMRSFLKHHYQGKRASKSKPRHRKDDKESKHKRRYARKYYRLKRKYRHLRRT